MPKKKIREITIEPKDAPQAADSEASEKVGGNARPKGERRRQIDPTTCERDYDQDEFEFMKAMDDYKRAFGRPFPTWSEVLEVIKSLGYRKVAERTKIVAKIGRGTTAVREGELDHDEDDDE